MNILDQQLLFVLWEKRKSFVVLVELFNTYQYISHLKHYFYVLEKDHVFLWELHEQVIS